MKIKFILTSYGFIGSIIYLVLFSIAIILTAILYSSTLLDTYILIFPGLFFGISLKIGLQKILNKDISYLYVFLNGLIYSLMCITFKMHNTLNERGGDILLTLSKLHNTEYILVLCILGGIGTFLTLYISILNLKLKKTNYMFLIFGTFAGSLCPLALFTLKDASRELSMFISFPFLLMIWQTVTAFILELIIIEIPNHNDDHYYISKKTIAFMGFIISVALYFFISIS